MKTRFFDLPLRFQIAIPFSILIMAVIVLAFGFGLPLAQKSAEEDQDLKLENARSLLQLALANQQDHLRSASAILAESPEVAHALQSGDTQGLPGLLSAFPSQVAADAVEVYDQHGALLYDLGDLGSLDVATWSSLRQTATTRGSATGLAVTGAGPMMLAVQPVASGFVVVGKSLSAVLEKLRYGSPVHFSVYREGQLVASTFPSQHGQPPPEVRTSPTLPVDASDPLKKGIVVAGKAYSVVYERPTLSGEPMSAIGVFLPRSEGWSADRFVAVGSAAVLAAALVLLALGFVVAQRIAARVERVVTAIEKIGDGDLSQEVSVDSADEVGRLGQVVNAMAAQLRQIERAKAQFLAMASHELRTPLALMKSSTDLLLESHAKPANGSQFELLQIVADNIDRMQRRVFDLLDLARMEAGDFCLQPRPTDIRRLVSEVAENARPLMFAKEQTLEVRLPPRLPLLHMDPDRVQQVLLNLLTNASRHTPAHSHIVVRAAAKRGAVQVEVSDDGPGVPRERLARLFDPTARPIGQNGGAGLGLLIAQRLVRLHGGEIWAESKPGQGSQFAFTIPRGRKRREEEQ
jgi:signal transduction histidine kinase